METREIFAICTFFYLRYNPRIMPLSYRIPLITGIILILTAIVNIASFQILSSRYFDIYITELAQTSNTPDPEKLQALLQISRLDAADQAEYLSILSEISNLSDSLQNISKNPTLYMSKTGYSGDSMISLPVSTPEKTLFPTMNLGAV